MEKSWLHLSKQFPALTITTSNNVVYIHCASFNHCSQCLLAVAQFTCILCRQRVRWLHNVWLASNDLFLCDRSLYLVLVAVCNMEVHDAGAFGGSPLDRLNNQRHRESFARECFDAPCVRVMLIDTTGTRVLMRFTQDDDEEKSSCKIGWLERATAIELAGAVGNDLDANASTCESNRILLLGATGEYCDVPNNDCNPDERPRIYHFAIRLNTSSVATDGKSNDANVAVGFGLKFWSLRSVAGLLSRDDAAIAAHALSLFAFHDRHAFCGTCGAPTVSEHGGGRRRCSRNKNTEHSDSVRHSDSTCAGIWFPRIDPVAIMLIIDSSGTRCLLGRQTRFPPGMWSCLAGFMEHGERIEDSVRREASEESGVRVGKLVRFFGSQPWPQPYSLMLGCVAQAISDEIRIDRTELADARWFCRDEVVSMVEVAVTRAPDWRRKRDGTEQEQCVNVVTAAKLFVPPSTSIAGQMLAAFAARDPVTIFPAISRL